MPKNQHGFRNNHPRKHQQHKPKISEYDEQNLVVNAFRQLSVELEQKHDRYERIVKLSRDITIESKRIIFSLHSIEPRKNNKSKVLEESQQRLNKLIDHNFNALAHELRDQDPYQFRSAYSPGLQEFIEAYTFMEYLKSEEETENVNSVSDWKALQLLMQYEDKKIPKKSENHNESAADAKSEAGAIIEQTENNDVISNKFGFFIDPTEYILGLSDLTGELMRRCINSLGCGETDICMETCKALQQFYTGYVSLNVQRARELSRKIATMRQSVLKAENVCYNVTVRGGEAAKWGAVFDKPNEDLDEGFY